MGKQAKNAIMPRLCIMEPANNPWQGRLCLIEAANDPWQGRQSFGNAPK